jgi:hypothetical protein
MTVQHLEHLYPEQAEWLSNCAKLRQASTLPEIVQAGLKIGIVFARMAVEQELKQRAEAAILWPRCSCGGTIRSKGFRPRQISTLVGCVK